MSRLSRLRSKARTLAQLPGGRRTKFAVVGIWVLIALAIGPLSGKFEDAQKNDPVDYLPGSAESVKALQELEDFPSGDDADAITVFHRDGGLTSADRAAIARTRASINAERRKDVAVTGPAVYSRDGGTALLITPIKVEDGSNEAADLLVDTTDDIKADLSALPDGLDAKVTGPAGFSADAIDVFGDIDGTLLYATAALVLILLIVIYRSPIFWLIPFFSVLLAEVSSRGFGYLLAEAGVTVTGQSGGILPVLVFGAGTDYALLMVSRYREELRRHEDKHDAIRVALRRTSPVILASGATVMAALSDPVAGRGQRHRRTGPDRRDGSRAGDGLDAHDAAGAPGRVRTPGVLAVRTPASVTQGPDETHGFWRRVAEWVGPGSAPRVDRHDRRAPGDGARAPAAERRPHHRQHVPRRRRLGAGPAADRRRVPGGSQRADQRRGHRRLEVDDVRTALAEAPGVAEVGRRRARTAGTKLEATLDARSVQHGRVRPDSGDPRGRRTRSRATACWSAAPPPRSSTCASPRRATTA